MAAIGIEHHANTFRGLNPDRTKKLIVGTGHPDDGNWHGTIDIGEFLDSSQRNGVFADTIAKSFISAIYSTWDEYFRHSIAVEFGVTQKQVKSDLMGDLRLIRNCIVHKKSILTDEPARIKELSWPLSPGLLYVTDQMFSGFIGQINHMAIMIEQNL